MNLDVFFCGLEWSRTNYEPGCVVSMISYESGCIVELFVGYESLMILYKVRV